MIIITRITDFRTALIINIQLKNVQYKLILTGRLKSNRSKINASLYPFLFLTSPLSRKLLAAFN